MKAIYIAAASIFAIAASPVFAGDLYVLGSVGRTSANLNQGAIDANLRSAGATGVSSNVNETDTGYKLQLGYQVNQNLAVEGGYVNLGKFTYSASFTGGSANATVEADGFNIAALGIIPIDESFSLFGKLGAIRAKLEASVSASGPGGSASGSASTSQWKGNYGVGAIYNFNKNASARLEFEQFHQLGDNNTTGGTSNVNMWSLGFAYKF